MDIKKGNYISRIWFLSKKGTNYDVLMNLMRQLPDGPWTLEYRFRYYKDDKTHGSEDEKSRWTATFPETMTEAEAIRKVAPVLTELKVMTGLKCDITVIESDDPQVVLHLMGTKKYFHIKAAGPLPS